MILRGQIALSILLGALLPSLFARAEEPLIPASCVAALSTEEEFRARLPERLRNLLSNERVRKSLVLNRGDYTHLYATLDRSRRNGGQFIDFHFGDLSIGMSARTSPDGSQLSLNIDYVQRSHLELGETSRHGREFLNLILGLTEWSSRQLAGDSTGRFRRIEIRGENLQNLRLIETLQGLGFTAPPGPGGNCTVLALVSAVYGGFGGMFLMFLTNDETSGMEAFLSFAAGAGGASAATAARVCSDIRGKDYRLVVELPN